MLVSHRLLYVGIDFFKALTTLILYLASSCEHSSVILILGGVLLSLVIGSRCGHSEILLTAYSMPNRSNCNTSHSKSYSQT
ncbi:hypothetical protein V1517DRAFT_325039 [Lipomyces orientalis]|uniref:Uncharacterized protein n=1 Tax=Lipomyces orientalis TaxID=1233043 RepID=A0ACC3TL84_9ASCO